MDGIASEEQWSAGYWLLRRLLAEYVAEGAPDLKAVRESLGVWSVEVGAIWAEADEPEMTETAAHAYAQVYTAERLLDALERASTVEQTYVAMLPQASQDLWERQVQACWGEVMAARRVEPMMRLADVWESVTVGWLQMVEAVALLDKPKPEPKRRRLWAR